MKQVNLKLEIDDTQGNYLLRRINESFVHCTIAIYIPCEPYDDRVAVTGNIKELKLEDK